MKMRKKEREEIIITELHSQQVEMVFLKAYATYTEIGGAEETNIHSEMVEIHRTVKMSKICNLQTIPCIQITTIIQIQIILQEKYEQLCTFQRAQIPNKMQSLR